jgi:hypothetical protein
MAALLSERWDDLEAEIERCTELKKRGSRYT